MAGNLFVIFCLLLLVLLVGRIQFRGVDAKPEFSTRSWFAMLFAAGMGIGLTFWSVAEPQRIFWAAMEGLIAGALLFYIFLLRTHTGGWIP